MNIENPDDLIYLNTAAVGQVSPESIAAAQKFQEGTLSNPMGVFAQWMEVRLPSLREKVAKLIHGNVSQIAFTPNFSYSIQSVITNIQPKIKKVLLYKDDYPSFNMPFELGEFDVHYVESKDGFSISIDEIKRISKREKIEVIALSHVQFLTGFTIDVQELGEFCKEEGIIFILDTTQSLSAVELDFNSLPVDVMISSSYKWLNGGPGSAILAIKESFMRKYPPRSAGFGSMTIAASGWNYKPSVKSYEPGHLNPLGLLQLEKGVDQRLKKGIAAVEKHNKALLNRLNLGLQKTSYEVCGGYGAEKLSTILCIGASQKVYDELSRNRFAVTWRKGLIRVSPHFYNTDNEIDRLVEVLNCIDDRYRR